MCDRVKHTGNRLKEEQVVLPFTSKNTSTYLQNNLNTYMYVYRNTYVCVYIYIKMFFLWKLKYIFCIKKCHMLMQEKSFSAISYH